MLHKYHAAMLQDTLGRIFSRTALVELIAANVGQDSLGNLIGHDAYHFDFSKFKEGLAYIENQHAIIQDDADPHMMRAAFGRLSHGAQDFYAHSNYVDLWLEKHGGLARNRPEDIDGLDPELLNSPRLRSGEFYLWRDFIYYVPFLGQFAQRYLVFAGSHEAMHLDEPGRGPRFAYAIEAAKQRTTAEYQRAARALSPERLTLFLGHTAPDGLPQPALAQ